MDNNPILKLLFRNVESTQMIRAKSSSKDKLQLQTNEHNNRNTIPIVKSAGNKCTTFNDSGYFLYRLIRAIPELCTCLKTSSNRYDACATPMLQGTTDKHIPLERYGY